MAETLAEKLWTFDAVSPGQAGGTTEVELTQSNIVEYAKIAGEYYPINYGVAEAGQARRLLALPTMALSYAPLLREEIAEANGFTAQEQSQTARRQTPFAKCEIRWQRPAAEGDVLTAARRVLEKYERRGSKFVTFRVEAADQQGRPVAEYDYTCIFDYAAGQRAAPDLGGLPPTSALAMGVPMTDEEEELEYLRMGIGARRLLKYAEIADGRMGGELRELAVTESAEIIQRKNDFRLAGRPSESNIHTDEEFARQNIFGGAVNSGPATMSYVDRMLRLSFPLEAFSEGARLLMRAITPFRSGDTVVFSGQATAQPPDAASHPRAVACRVKGENHRGELVCLAEATLHLPE